MAFCAQEFQTFFGHLGGVIKQYKATGQLPDTIFKGAAPSQAAPTGGDKKAKIKRKPTAFNMFVKDKMEEFKAAGVKLDDDKNGNLLFTLAVSEWKKLDEEQKQEYTRNFKASIEDTDEPENVMTDAALDFSPGPSASAPVSPTSAAPDPHNEESDEGNKNKRKTMDADPQGLVADINTSLLDQANDVAPGNTEKRHKKKKKDKK